jgi:hypothetical protein
MQNGSKLKFDDDKKNQSTNFVNNRFACYSFGLRLVLNMNNDDLDGF